MTTTEATFNVELIDDTGAVVHTWHIDGPMDETLEIEASPYETFTPAAVRFGWPGWAGSATSPLNPHTAVHKGDRYVVTFEPELDIQAPRETPPTSWSLALVWLALFIIGVVLLVHVLT